MSVRPCYKQAEFIQRIQGALGVGLGSVQCHIVDSAGMGDVMRTAGWSKNEAAGVVGFQLGNNVYVLGSAPWTVLHELIHRGGVNADRISRFVAEGLTEAIAIELKKGPDEHRATYPTESAWVRTRLLPRLRMSAVELGKRIAHSSDPPGTLADLMVAVDPKLDRAKLVRQLRPQGTEQPSFNRHAQGCVTRAPARAPLGSPAPALSLRRVPRDDGVSTGLLAGLLLLSGAALAAPVVVDAWNGSGTVSRDRL